MSDVVVINLWPRESECCCCGKLLFGCKLGLPLYEGEPVTLDHTGEWGGSDACEECYKGYQENAHDANMLHLWWHIRRSTIDYSI